LPHRHPRDEIQFEPQSIQLALFSLVENQFAQGFIIPKIPLHEMKAGGEQAAFPCTFGIEIRPAVGNKEGVRKNCTKSLQFSTQAVFGFGIPCLCLAKSSQPGVGALELAGQFAQIGKNFSRIAAMPARQLPVPPQYQWLAAIGDSTDLQFVDLRLELLPQAKHQVAQALAARSRNRRRSALRL